MFEQGCEAISSLAGRVLYVLGQPEDGLALHWCRISLMRVCT